MAEQNKAVLRRHLAEIWSQGNVALVDELFASDCLSHAPVAQRPLGFLHAGHAQLDDHDAWRRIQWT